MYIVYVSLLWLIVSFAIAVAHSLCKNINNFSSVKCYHNNTKAGDACKKVNVQEVTLDW